MTTLSQLLGLTRAHAKAFRRRDDIRMILAYLQKNIGEICADAIVSLNTALPNGTVCSVNGKLYLAGLDDGHTIAIDEGHSYMESKIENIKSIHVGPGTGQEDPVIRILIQ